jgi:hypothetical protein
LEESKQPQLNPDEIDWCEIDGDPDAGRMPRRWHNVAVLATDHTVYDGLDPEYLSKPGRTKDAIAWISEGIVRIGVSADADNLFGGTVVGDESKFTVAKRLSTENLRATIGLWLPAEQRLVVGNNVSVLNPSLPINELAADPQYRHTSVV